MDFDRTIRFHFVLVLVRIWPRCTKRHGIPALVYVTTLFLGSQYIRHDFHIFHCIFIILYLFSSLSIVICIYFNVFSYIWQVRVGVYVDYRLPNTLFTISGITV